MGGAIRAWSRTPCVHSARTRGTRVGPGRPSRLVCPEQNLKIRLPGAPRAHKQAIPQDIASPLCRGAAAAGGGAVHRAATALSHARRSHPGRACPRREEAEATGAGSASVPARCIGTPPASASEGPRPHGAAPCAARRAQGAATGHQQRTAVTPVRGVYDLGAPAGKPHAVERTDQPTWAGNAGTALKDPSWSVPHPAASSRHIRRVSRRSAPLQRVAATSTIEWVARKTTAATARPESRPQPPRPATPGAASEGRGVVVVLLLRPAQSASRAAAPRRQPYTQLRIREVGRCCHAGRTRAVAAARKKSSRASRSTPRTSTEQHEHRTARAPTDPMGCLDGQLLDRAAHRPTQWKVFTASQGMDLGDRQRSDHLLPLVRPVPASCSTVKRIAD